jgi:hypothetical protein
MVQSRAPHGGPTIASARPLVPGILRPRRPDDLGPCPPGWIVGPPDFVGIGCGRAGSTWLWSLVQQHPQVVAGRLADKELHYFQHFGWNGPDADAIALYRQAFAAPPGAICGDGSFSYLTHPLMVDHLWRAAPEARLLAIVRNPVDRFVSVLDQLTRVRLPWLGLDGDRAYVQRTYSFWGEAAAHCRIADGVRAVARRWPSSALHVLQYEQFVQDPRGHFAALCRFLGIDDRFVPADAARPVNREPAVIAAPDAAARRRLAEFFEADVDAVLDAWPSIDRTLWTDFR